MPSIRLRHALLASCLLATASLAFAQAAEPEAAVIEGEPVAAEAPAETAASEATAPIADAPTADATPATDAAAEAEAAAPAAMTAAPTTLPSLDPDAYFKGQTGGTFGKNVTKVLPANKRVAVAGFRVLFVTDNSIKAQVRASYFGGTDRSGASARMDVGLDGVDYATMQAITDKAYADFLAQLALAGREVVPQAELQEFLGQVEVTQQPYVKEATLGYGKQTAMAFSPSGMPLWFTNWDMPWGDKNPFKQGNYRSFIAAPEKLNAILVAPMIVVDFAQMSSSGNRSGFLARNAEVGATLSMSVSGFSTPLSSAIPTSSGKAKKGDDATLALQQPFVSEIGFANLEQVKKSDNSATKGMFDAIGNAMGLANAGGMARSKSNNAARTNNDAYREAALDALNTATGTFAAWFRKYPAN